MSNRIPYTFIEVDDKADKDFEEVAEKINLNSKFMQDARLFHKVKVKVK